MNRPHMVPAPSCVVTGAERRLAVEHWLLSAAPDVGQARWDWQEGGATFLRCGGLFTAVRLHGYIVHAAAGSQDPPVVDDFLARMLEGGPVIVGHGLTRYYALVPPSAAHRWQSRGAECLPQDTWLGVPPVGRTKREGSEPYWAVPMNNPATLCSPGLVAQLNSLGQKLWTASQ